MTVITPHAVEGLSRTLARASAQRLSVSPRGGNTTTEKFMPPLNIDLNIDMTRLNRAVEYEPANLTITVEAGMTLAALQSTLAQHGQFLPIDPPQAERATVGGVIATNASGPLRQGYGTVRDWLIGVRVALADGRIVRGGGRVVKNVAGYDLPKLFVGSMGTLGVVVDATFKVAPLPAHSRTLAAAFQSHAEAVQALLPVLRSALMPIALTVLDPVAGTQALQTPTGYYILLARFAGGSAAVERQAREFEARCQARDLLGLQEYEGALETSLWSRVCDLPVTAGHNAVVAELRLRPSLLDEAVQAVQDAAGQNGLPGALFSHAARSLWAALRPADGAILLVVSRLREWIEGRKGWLVVQRTPPSLAALLDPWGAPRSDFAIMQRLKAQFDPQNILNSGVFVGGL